MNALYRLAATLLPVTCVQGCSPALDWRDVRPEGSALQLQFPCRPAAQQRQVSLAGSSVRLHLEVCDAGGQTWGLSHGDVGDPARVTPALLQLREAAAANITGPQPSATAAASFSASGSASARAHAPAPAPAPVAVNSPGTVPGMTPNPASMRARLSGNGPDGRPVQMQIVVFAHGTRVFQATVLGAELPLTGADTYFASMAIRP